MCGVIPATITLTSFSGAGSFSDGAPYAENVCDTCHSQTLHHQADGTAPNGQNHQDSENCTGCHSHDTAFMPPTEVPDAPHDTILQCFRKHPTRLVSRSVRDDHELTYNSPDTAPFY